MSMPLTIFCPETGGSAKITATTTSAATEIPLNGISPKRQLRIANDGSANCFIEFGGSAVAATSTGTSMYVKAGSQGEIFTIPDGAGFVALKAASGTVDIYITRGEGA